MSQKIRIRPGRPRDAAACLAIYRGAVHVTAAATYTKEERDAWAPEGPTPGWSERLLAGTCLVATTWWGRPVGFMTMGRDGHLDFAYVHPDYTGRGVASTLYHRIENIAREQGISTLTTQSSLSALPFFTRHGWTREARQSVIRHGVALTNYRMFKNLR